MKLQIAIIILFLPFFVYAEQIQIRHNQNQINLTPTSSFYKDKTGNLTLEQIQKLHFNKIEKNFSYGNDVVWFKIEIRNQNHENDDWILVFNNRYIEYIDFYVEESQKGKFQQKLLGRFRERQHLRLAEYEPYIDLKLKKSESKIIYLKIKSNISTNTNFEIFTKENFNHKYLQRLLIQGVVLGLVFLRLFYVLILGFFVVKDQVFKRYSFLLILRSITYLGLQSILGSLIFNKPIPAGIANFVAYHITPIGLVLVLEILLPIKNWNIFTRHFPKFIIILNLALLPLIIFDYQRAWVLASFGLFIFTQSTIILFFVYAIIKKIKFDINYSFPYLLGLTTFLVSQLSLIGFELKGANTFATFTFILEIFIFGLFLGRIIINSEKTNTLTQSQLDFSLLHSIKLEELDKLKTRFFTNISHEFRTPLTLLVGPIDDLKKKYPQEGIIATMQRNLQRLQTLINQILDLSKLEAGEMKPNLQEIDLAKFLDQLFASFESLAQSKGILFNHSQSHLTQIGMVDIDKLEKIIVNLLSNAFKFTEKNGRISLRIEYLSNKLKLEIKDTGIGISEERLPKIFDRFYQVEEHKNYEGTGVGLALVKELVDLLNGTIEVSSKVGEGTIFNLVLPFIALEKLSNSVTRIERKGNLGETLIEPKIENSIEPDGQSIMLIVEDNPDLRNYIASVFENQYQLITAIDGEDGLAKATEFIPDIVISDLMMPKLDGLSFCEKLKSDERTNHIPVVMLTAKASLSDRLVGLEHGADDYLSKPFNKEELQIRVKNLVSQRQKLLEKFSNKTIIEKIEDIHEPTMDEIFINKCKSVIDKYLDKSEFDVEKFADEMNLSSVQLRRKLKAISDQTVTEFVRNYRLGIAANLLKKSDLLVSEIAYQVGFDSLPYFSKVFQEKYGKVASEWKE